jgi:UDP-glucuronate 4-epimerase
MVLSGKKILITGASGQVGRPVAEALAADNEVWCLARFSNPATKPDLEAQGIKTFAWDMTAPDFTGLPRDFTHVFHAGIVSEFQDHTLVVRPTCEATASLMQHCSAVEAFTYVSSTIVYQRLEVGHRHAETDPLGGLSTPTFMPAYSTTKLSAEATVRAVSHLLDIPTTIARLNLAYGFPTTSVNMGRMIPRYVASMQAGDPILVQTHESYASPLHVDDIVRQVPELWRVASVPVTIMNWGNDDCVGERELIGYVSELIDTPAKVEASELSAIMVADDPSYRQSLIGGTEMAWRDGVRRAIETYYPNAIA